MVQKIHPQGVIWVPSSPPHAGHLSEKNDDLGVQYEDCLWPSIHSQRADFIVFQLSVALPIKSVLRNL